MLQSSIRELIPQSDTFPPLVIVQTDPIQNKLLGINVETGEDVWTCPGPIGRTADLTSYNPLNEIALLGGKSTEPPLVYFQYDSMGECRQAFLSPRFKTVDDSWSRLAFSGTSKAPAVTKGLKYDPRWKRALPWRIELASMVSSYSIFGWAAFFSLTMVVGPAYYVGQMIARRRYNLRYLLMLPVVMAIFFQAILIAGPDDNFFGTFVGKLSIAVFFSPVVASLLLIARWAISRRWRRIVLWGSALAATSMLLAAIGLLSSIRSMPLAAEESFDWQGWYLIVIPAGSFLSWVIIFATFAELLGRKLVRRFQARKIVRSQPDFGNLSLDASGVATIAHPATQRDG